MRLSHRTWAAIAGAAVAVLGTAVTVGGAVGNLPSAQARVPDLIAPKATTIGAPPATVAASPAPSSPAKPSAGTSAKPKTRPVTLDSRCLEGTVICVSKTDRTLRYVVNGKVVRSYAARFGSAANITREGAFRVLRKVPKDWSYPYHEWMPYAMYFSGGEAVHFSSDFAEHGYQQGSHGCVNLRDLNGAKWLYEHTPVGTTVVVYR